jgi:UDP-N-acetylglucosamine 4,6-dehydratase
MRVAVTGITGTFGRAFTRRVLGDGLVERLVGLSRDELKQADMAEAHATDEPLRLFLGDVRDLDRLREAFYHCDTVVHAAALKRVDAIAYNPGEVIKTNVIGTENVIRAAVAAKVRNVLVISSDKAVSPLNIYGSSKSLAEQIAVHSNTWAHPQGTRVAALRYGNVLGSRGSVVHLWRRQAEADKPLTLTDRRMTRFLLTIQTGVQLALDALSKMHGGEVFVPVLPSAKMVDLARAIGGPDGQVVETGLRAGGEKLAEALLSDDEPARSLHVGNFYVVRPHVQTWSVPSWRGDSLPAGYRYVSDGSHGWLSVDDIGRMLKEACV